MDSYYYYRVGAYVAFFTGLLVFWGGILVSLYHVSAVGTIVSLVLGTILFLTALYLGGKGWSVFKTPESSMVFTEDQQWESGHLVRGYGAMNPDEPPLGEHHHGGPETLDEEAGDVPLEQRRGMRGYGAMNPDEPPLGQDQYADPPQPQRRPTDSGPPG